MKRLAGKFACRCIIVALEILAVLTVLLVIASGILMWRLSTGPVPLNFAREYVEQALTDPESGIFVAVEKIALQWPEPSAPVMIGLKGVSLFGAENTGIFSVDEAGLILSLSSLASGDIHPQSILLKKPSLHILRSEDGTFGIGLPKEKAPKKDNISSEMLATFKTWARRDTNGTVPDILSELELLEIEGARLTLEDRKLKANWELPDTSFEISRSESGALISSLLLISSESGQTSMEASLEYKGDTDVFTFSSQVENFDPDLLEKKIDSFAWLEGHELTLDAKVKIWLDGQLHTKIVTSEISSNGGTILLPEIYPDPQKFSYFNALIEYNHDSGILSIPEASLSFADIKLNAVTETSLKEDKIFLPIKASISSLPLSTIEEVFPPSLSETTAHKWLVQRMENGEFKNFELTGALNIAKEDFNVSLEQLYAKFDFEGVDVDYQAPLMPAMQSGGTGFFDYQENRLFITGQAMIGELEAREIKLDFLDVMTTGGGTANIDAKLEGPLAEVLAYLAREPIGYGDELGLDIDQVKGAADLSVNVRFPTVKDLKKEEVKIAASGTFNNVLLPDMVSGLPLGGGPLSIEVGEEAFDINGSGLLSGRDVSFSWKQYFSSEGKPFSSQVKAKINADRELRGHFGVELDEYLSGTVPLDIIYTYQISGHSTVNISADLKPVTLKFEPLSYSKPVGREGECSLRVKLFNGEPVEVNSLRATAPSLSLSGGKLTFGEVKGKTDVNRARIEHLSMGKNDFGIEYERENEGLIKMALKGAYLDARPFLDGTNKAKANNQAYPVQKQKNDSPMIISADVATMQTIEDRFVSTVKLYMTLDNTGDITQLEMDALAGKGDIYLRYKPDELTRRKEFRMEATDAGATLRAFGLYDNVVGGKLTIQGDPSGHAVRGGDLAGVAQLSDFRVINAPILARLLSAMSLPGINQLLGNEGIIFSRLEAQFDWLSRPQGALLVVKEGRTSGNSLGLTFEGVVDRETNQIDLSGTIVPLSMLNSIIGAIPLVGDLLAGGAGGAIFAATYTVKGALKEPDIIVNPLAALAPGILRRILFEGG